MFLLAFFLAGSDRCLVRTFSNSIFDPFSELMGMCYIETANLDGETNLKIRQVRTPLHSMEQYVCNFT